jgi:hypothetical protein
MFWLFLIHIARGAHGVLDKNKNVCIFFYSRPHNNLPPKISCGRGTIFARGAHVRAKGRGAIFFASPVLCCFLEPATRNKQPATIPALLKLNTAADQRPDPMTPRHSPRLNSCILECLSSLFPFLPFVFFSVNPCQSMVGNSLSICYKMAYNRRLAADSGLLKRVWLSPDVLLACV